MSHTQVYPSSIWLLSDRQIAWREVIAGDDNNLSLITRSRILVQVTIYRGLLIGRDGYLDQSEAYDIS